MTDKDAVGLLLVMMEVDPDHEEEFNRWYWEEHVPERLAVEGIKSARRYVAVEGKPKYLALYELESADVLQTPEYRKLYDNPTPWTLRMRKVFKPTRNVYVEIKKPE